MERYQVILAYDGTNFLGFQRQGIGRTVQSELEKALRQLNWQGQSVLLAGRTDSGVHASGQVVSFDLDWKHPPEALVRAINANLPPDVAATRAAVVGGDFHPRYHASARCYRFRIYCAEQRNPLLDRYAWRVWPKPELTRLEAAARELVGKYDFSAFGSPMKPGGSTVREIFTARWEETEEGLAFEVRGNAFLYHMVRRMVYLQTQAGQQHISVEEFRQAVRAAKPLKAGLAEPQGLTLTEVEYDGSRQGNNVQMEFGA